MTRARYTRQQDRREMRAMWKQLRTLRKEDAMKHRRPGGAATHWRIKR
jgi:hypothetical protein